MRTTIVRILGTLAVLVALLGSTATAASAASSSAATASALASAPRTDYCGTPSTAWVPDGWGRADFRAACGRHDECYSATSTTSRSSCDQALQAELRTACASAYGPSSPSRYLCYGVAFTYYEGVRAFGRLAYSGNGSPA